MNLTRQFLVHVGRLLRIGGDERFVDSILDMTLDDGRDGGRERARDVGGDLRTEEQLLDLEGKSLQRLN